MDPLKIKICLGLLVLALASLACSELTITNSSPTTVKMMVRLPEGNGVDTKTLFPDESVTYYSDTEGGYTVSVIPDEAAREYLESIRRMGQVVLADKEAVGNADPYQLSHLLKSLVNVEKTLNDMSEKACSGRLTSDANAAVRIYFNKDAGGYEISCSSE